jgi:murein DD-endopeptidase MepM/ murein hydrolase activator NlpD
VDSTGAYAHPCPACSLTQGFTAGVHNGLDLAAPIGTPIYAAADGSVTAAGPRDPGGFGQVVYINNDDGTVAWYGHIDTWLVNVGDHVVAGQQIATVGNRGNATGPHLHFEIHAPNPVDPAPWLRAHGVNI